MRYIVEREHWQGKGRHLSFSLFTPLDICIWINSDVCPSITVCVYCRTNKKKPGCPIITVCVYCHINNEKNCVICAKINTN